MPAGTILSERQLLVVGRLPTGQGRLCHRGHFSAPADPLDVVPAIGGLIFAQALGVGYDTIGAFVQGDVRTQIILGARLVKSISWAGSLGSGTSGGVLAPLLMMGGALGGSDPAPAGRGFPG